MKRRHNLTFLLAFGLIAVSFNAPLLASVSLLTGPSSVSSPSTTIKFDGFADGTVANSLYSGQGVTFSRDDGQPVNILDWSDIPRQTVSRPNVLGTVSGLGASTYVSHLNVDLSPPIHQIGAFFGNDQDDPDFMQITLLAYGAGGGLLGRVSQLANNNISVDQFIGLQSDQAIARVRFQNEKSSGGISIFYSVVIDDLIISTVPEPSSICLIFIGLLILGRINCPRSSS